MAGLGVSTASIAGIAAVIGLISALVVQIKKYKEEQRASADEASNSFKTLASDIDGYKTKISELKSALASGNLSEQEAYDVRQQLVGIQDEVIEKYGDEVEGLNLLKDSAEESTKVLESLTIAQAKRNLEDPDNKAAYEEAARKMEKEREYTYNITQAIRDPNLNKVIYDTIGKYDNITIDESRYNGTQLKITGDTTEAQAALNDLYDAILQFGGDGDSVYRLKESIQSSLSNLDGIIEDFGSRYQDYLEQQVFSNEDYIAVANQVNGYVEALQEAILNEDLSGIQDALFNLENFDLSGIEDSSIREYFQRIIDAATKDGDAYETEIKINANFKPGNDNTKAFQEYLKDFTDENGEVDVSLIGSMALGDFSTASAEQIRAYQMMQIIAGAYGGTVLDVVDYLAEQGIVTKQVTDATSEEAEVISATAEELTAMAKAHKTAASAMQEMASGGLSQDTTLSLMQELTEAGLAWNDYLYEENGQVKLNTAAYLELADAKTKATLADKYAKRDSLMATLNSGNTGSIERSMAQSELAALNDEISILEATLNDDTAAVNAFFDSFSAGQSKLETVSEIMESVSTGGFTQSQALDWIQSIPELASYYDAASNSFSNLDAALQGIVDSGCNDFIEQTTSYLEDNAEMADEDRAAIEALQVAFKDMSAQTLNSNKALAVLNKGVTTSQKPFKKLRTQIDNLWNSDVFSDARADLIELAKSSGITASDINDLADENIYLKEMLNQSGVSAASLAEIFERLSLSGTSALSAITDDAIRVNTVLSEMDSSLQKVSDAYDKYQSTLGTWEYDDGFNNYVEAYKNLGEMFEDGTYGADFYRTIDYLYGEGHGADSIESLYQQYKKLGQVFSEDDNGLGFIQKLYDMQSKLGGDWIQLDSNGNYIWNISPDDFAGIAAGLSMTEEEVAACIEALGMFGNFTEYDPEKLISTFRDLDMALIDTEGNAVLSEQAVRSMLETLGLESWQIDQAVAKLKEADGLTLFDSNDVNDVQNVVDLLNELGNIRVDDGVIGLDALTSSLRAFGLSNDEIAAFMQTLSGMGYTFRGITGEILGFEDALSRIDGTPLENIKQEAEDAQKSLNSLNGLNLDINFNSSDAKELTSDFNKLKKMRDTLVNDDGTIKIGMEDSYSQLTAMMYALIEQKNTLEQPFIMSVDTSEYEGEIYSLIESLQTLYALTQEKVALIEIGADASEIQSVQGEIDSQIASIQATNPEILASFGLDSESSTTEIFTAIGQIQDSAALEKIMLAAGVDPTEVEAFIGEPHNAKGTVTWKNNTTLVDRYASTTKVGKGIVYWQNNTANVKTTFTGTGTVKPASVVNGTAHASGNWGTKRKETALVSELGPEIIVDPNSGSWYTVGDHGAQFVDIPKGAIVFNHKQTAALLKYGRVAGRGKALVNGTAYASGSTSIKNPATGKYYTSSYKSNYTPTSSISSANDEAEEFAERLDWIETIIDRIERKISRLNITASSTFSKFSDRSAALGEQMGAVTQEIEYQAQACEEYFAAANNVELSDEYKELVRNGALVLETITDEDLRDKINEFKELYERGLDASDAVVQLNEDLAQLYQDSFDLSATRFDSIISLIESDKNRFEEYINQVEESGHIVTANYYNALINNQRETLGKLNSERIELTNKLNEAVSSGAIAEGSEAWYEMKKQILDVSAAIDECTTSLIEYQNAIRQLDWDLFDRTQESISQLNDEAEFYLELLDRNDSFDDTGKITDDGMAKMGLHVQRYNTYMAQADLYANEIKKIESELNNDPGNVDLIERKRELISAQWDAVLAAEAEKDALISLAEDGVDKYMSSLKSLIDEYTDALDSAKNMYEYQKKIKSQTEKINSLRKQLYAYGGDTSEEAQKTIQELKVSLKDAEDDLQETQYEQYISDQKALLNELYDQVESILNARLDDVDGLIMDCIDATNQNADTISSTIYDAADKVGVDVSSEMSAIWDNINDFENLFSMYGDNFLDSMTSIMAAIQGIIDAEQEAARTSAAQGITDQMRQNSEAWYYSSDEVRGGLHQANEQLADSYKTATGENIYYDSGSGTWYHEDGSELYSTNIGQVKSLVSQMKQNGTAWHSASPSEQARLSQENEDIAAQISSMTGERVYKDSNGVWWIGNRKLFETYHSGLNMGVVGGSKLRDDEKLAILQDGEVVMTRDQWMNNVNKLTNGMYDIIDQMLESASMRVPDNPAEFINGRIPTPIKNSSSVNNVQNQVTMSLVLPNVKNYDDFVNELRGDKKFEKMIQSMTVDRLSGGSSLNKNKYQW